MTRRSSLAAIYQDAQELEVARVFFRDAAGQKVVAFLRSVSDRLDPGILPLVDKIPAGELKATIMARQMAKACIDTLIAVLKDP